MLKLTKEQFLQDKNVFDSTVELLADSYLNPKIVLETALLKSDTIYYQAENSVVQAIALSKLFTIDKYPEIYFIYLGMTAAKKTSKKGQAFNCVIKSLTDTFKKIGFDKPLYAISSISTPFTYNYYKKFSKSLQPNLNGEIQNTHKDLFQTTLEFIFHKTSTNGHYWLLKECTQTRYKDEELVRIDSYLKKNNVYLFDQEIFDLKRGDRVIVLGEVNEKLETIFLPLD